MRAVCETSIKALITRRGCVACNLFGRHVVERAILVAKHLPFDHAQDFRRDVVTRRLAYSDKGDAVPHGVRF